MMKEKLLEVKGLKTDFLSEGAPRRIVDDISFYIDKGEVLGVVGESGSGKSVTAKSILRLIPSPPGQIVGGEILFEGEDILKLDIKALMGPEPFRIAGNLPYYITTPIMMKLWEDGLPVDQMAFMVQQEVADRMTAAPGGKEYGALTVAVQFRSIASQICSVPADSFLPPPAVSSAVVHCNVLKKPPVSVPSEKVFFRVARAAFAQRRKTLANSLKGAGIEPETVESMLQATGIDGSRRGETLSLAEFAKLSWEYANKKESVEA